MISSTSELSVSLTKGVRVIRFNRPTKKNAINAQMYTDITNILNTDANDDDVKICVVTGTGEIYSSGNDIMNSNSRQLLESGDPSSFEKAIDVSLTVIDSFIKAFIDYPKLLIAVVNGPAIGVATTTLALFDIVYASDKATFQTPFSVLGLCPEGCSSYTFAKIMGTSKANEMLFLNYKMCADEALRIGFVSDIFSHTKVAEVINKIIDTYSDLSLYYIKAAKRLTRENDLPMLHNANRIELKQLKACFFTEEFMNAMMNFMMRKNKSKL